MLPSFRRSLKSIPAPPTLQWHVDESSVYEGEVRIRGWCHNVGSEVIRIEMFFPETETAVALSRINLPSPDVAAAVHATATSCRFDDRLQVPTELLGHDFHLRITLTDRTVFTTGSVLTHTRRSDAFHVCWTRFLNQLKEIPSGAILEVGSRARSAITYRKLLPAHLDYVGLDILPGPNVDVVGDAHRLSELFDTGRFIAAFSLSVFEHLAMPWKVALELNHVLAPNGLVFTGTHQTWPMHEEPWDFWRFSAYSWRTIFNEATGFEIVETALGEPARILPGYATTSNWTLPNSSAWLGCASIVKKVADTKLSWPVSVEVAAREMYPKGELSQPPH